MRGTRHGRMTGGGMKGYGFRGIVMKIKRYRLLIAVVLIGFGGWAVLFQTDLMPEQRAKVVELLEDIVSVTRVGRIRGIVCGEDLSTVVIDDQTVREGQSIYGVTVVKIYPDRVEFDKNGVKWSQELNAAPSRHWGSGFGTREETESKAKALAEAKAEAEAKAQAEAEAKAQQEAEAKLAAEAQAKAQAQAEAKARQEAEAKARQEAEAKLKAEAQAREREEAQAQEQAQAEEKARQEAEDKEREEAEAKAREEAEAKAQAEAEAKAKELEEATAKTEAETEAKAQEETETRAQVETETKAREQEAVAEPQEEVKTETTKESAEPNETTVPESAAISTERPEEKDTQNKISELINQLGDRESYVRDSAVTSLAQIGPSAVPLLIRAVEEANWVVRQEAARALGEIGDRQAVGPLIAALTDKNQWIRQSAAKALGQIRDERAIESLVEVLDDDIPSVRTTAAAALVSIRGFALPQEQTSGSVDEDKTILGKIIDLKIYIGSGAAVVLLLCGLAIARIKRQKKASQELNSIYHY